MKYTSFQYQPNYTYTSGWDKFALKYSALGAQEIPSLYSLHKEILHAHISKRMHLQGKRVLDVNCGTGNDFPFFLAQDCQITGTDISTGMLNKAHERYATERKSGRVELLQGDINTLSNDSLEGSYDLIYNITGGLSYCTEEQLLAIHRQLGHFLAPGGKIITAHFSPCCIAERLFYLSRGKIGPAFIRRHSSVPVTIDKDSYRLYFRNPERLSRLLSQDFAVEDTLPLLLFTPPYQTGLQVSPDSIPRRKQRELRWAQYTWMSRYADQFFVVLSKKNTRV